MTSPDGTELISILDDLERTEVRATVWRHMFNDYLPDRANVGGARWNSPGTAAIYVSMQRETAIAEGDHAVKIQPAKMFARRVLYELSVEVNNVLDLSSSDLLMQLGVPKEVLAGPDFQACQAVADSAISVGASGLIVPSARHQGGTNLVIYVAEWDIDSSLETNSEVELPSE
jgi:RES domain-containing protein